MRVRNLDVGQRLEAVEGSGFAPDPPLPRERLVAGAPPELRVCVPLARVGPPFGGRAAIGLRREATTFGDP